MPEKIFRLLLQPLRLYAACGFIFCGGLHLLAIAGLQPSDEALLFGPGIAIFPLWLPVTHLSMNLTRGLGRKEAWKVMFSGGPKWMRYITKFLYWYAIVNFVIVVVITILIPPTASSSGNAPRIFWILASSYYMLFYFSGLAFLTTVRGKEMPKCPNGHPVWANDKYCRVCGAPIPPANGGAEMRGAA
jgi:hypothetical protein